MRDKLYLGRVWYQSTITRYFRGGQAGGRERVDWKKEGVDRSRDRQVPKKNTLGRYIQI